MTHPADIAAAQEIYNAFPPPYRSHTSVVDIIARHRQAEREAYAAEIAQLTARLTASENARKAAVEALKTITTNAMRRKGTRTVYPSELAAIDSALVANSTLNQEGKT